MSHERIEWKKAQTEGLRKLIESAQKFSFRRLNRSYE